MRGQAGDEHGGSPWFKGGVEPRRMARVVDAVGRRASSQSFPPRSGLVQDPLSPVLDGRLVVKRKKSVPEGPCADDGLTASRCGLSGTGFLNEAASRWADCLPPMEIEWRERLPVDPRRMVSSGSGTASLS